MPAREAAPEGHATAPTGFVPAPLTVHASLASTYAGSAPRPVSASPLGVEVVRRPHGRRSTSLASRHPRRAMLRRRRFRRRVILSVVLAASMVALTLVVDDLIVTPCPVPPHSVEEGPAGAPAVS